MVSAKKNPQWRDPIFYHDRLHERFYFKPETVVYNIVVYFVLPLNNSLGTSFFLSSSLLSQKASIFSSLWYKVHGPFVFD